MEELRGNSIEKLKGNENLTPWKAAMECLLMTKGIWETVMFGPEGPDEKQCAKYGILKERTSNRNWFKDLKNIEVYAAGSEVMTAKGMGTVDISINGRRLSMSKVLYVPSLNCNLMSETQLVEAGYQVTFNGSTEAVISKNGQTMLEIPRKNGLYSVMALIAKTNLKEEDSKLIHKRYGHTVRVAFLSHPYFLK